MGLGWRGEGGIGFPHRAGARQLAINCVALKGACRGGGVPRARRSLAVSLGVGTP